MQLIRIKDELVKHVINIQQMFCGLTSQDIHRLPFQFADRSNIQHPFDKVKQMAAVDWLKGFMKRHKDKITLRTPEVTNLTRAVGFNNHSVDKFTNLYRGLIEKNEFTGDRIWNIDESGLTSVHKPGRVLAKRGQM
jgi:hypothetical protein